ncbi:GGDEF domain-containing protein [Jeotgalibaca ciconiae]|uniref:GGDEF domain-containing protein n=1 Tax=Jeotgalibaca ciconiae TaxID=2496265 RepID=A0A3S9H8K3_9LACT|nr:GGDEF domain-containing protein [Jeotgalibaca ciconiae]AZP03680.1 GGDEF domain-containing protein [Jeotgalibaca ciconiae]
MFANIIANIAVIMIPIYLYYRINSGVSDKEFFTRKEFFLFILVETILGIALLELSIFFMGAYLDFRPLLFSISMIYLGWKITIPSMLLVEIVYLYFTMDKNPLIGVLGCLFLALSMCAIKKIAEKKFQSYGQLIALVTFNLIITAISSYFFLQNLDQTFLFYLIISIFGYAMITALYFMMDDLRILRERTDYDYLTHLLNVRKFKERLNKLENNRQTDMSVAVLDIDWFKSYNDRYGHDAGDKILWGIAQVFSAYSTNNTTIYRIGGEEFAIIITGLSLKEAELAVADIMDNVVNRPIPINRHHTISVTLSVGLAYAREDESFHKVWKRADSAMYKAKNNGRDQLYVSDRNNDKYVNPDDIMSTQEINS